MTPSDMLVSCAAHRTPVSSLFLCPGFVLEYMAIDCTHAGDLGASRIVLVVYLGLK